MTEDFKLAPLERGGGYQVILADPPWDFRANAGNHGDDKARAGRNARAHYACMKLPEIAALPVREIVADQAVLFMWITGPFLAIGAHLPIMKAWGFKPKAMGFTWVKTRRMAQGRVIDLDRDLHVGLGMTTRKNAEFCMIGTRGLSMRVSTGVHEVGVFPLREHSRKPDEFRTRIESYVGLGKRMAELFAREAAPGWEAFGNETGKFASIAPE